MVLGKIYRKTKIAYLQGGGLHVFETCNNSGHQNRDFMIVRTHSKYNSETELFCIKTSLSAWSNVSSPWRYDSCQEGTEFEVAQKHDNVAMPPSVTRLSSLHSPQILRILLGKEKWNAPQVPEMSG
jgi:hypothetical protein